MDIPSAVPPHAADPGGGLPIRNQAIWIAALSAIFAMALAYFSVVDGNVIQSIQETQTDLNSLRSTVQRLFFQELTAEANVADLRAMAAGLGTAGIPLTARAVEQESAGREFQQARVAAEKDAQALEDKLTALNFRDDQFDLAEAALAIAIAMLAIVALTGQRWLYWGSLLPGAFGLFMGLAGTFQWPILPRFLTQLVS